MTDTIKELQNYRNGTIETIRNIDDHNIVKAVQILLHARNNGAMIFVFGNGGSGSTASHKDKNENVLLFGSNARKITSQI